MTARQWRAGDVAYVKYVNQIALVRPRNAANNALEFSYVNGRFDMVDDEQVADNARPLLVIDVEDRVQVAHLCSAYWTQRSEDERHTTDRMQAALRSLLAPPKPEEPTSFGAVVRDADNALWLHHGHAESTTRLKCWRREGIDEWRDYADIDAVEVLSPGVGGER